MTKERVTLREFVQTCENEGLDYTLHGYYAPEHMPTQELEDLHRQYNEIRAKIAALVGVE